jgi:hypothetical protein
MRLRVSKVFYIYYEQIMYDTLKLNTKSKYKAKSVVYKRLK